jgi:hypothetical protein
MGTKSLKATQKENIGVFRRWERILRYFLKGSKGQTPHELKQEIIKYWLRKRRIRVVVETGTYRGQMTEAIRHKADQIYSIELDPSLAMKARQRFANCPEVQILEGDSAKLLPGLAASITEKCVFWLDGHYSGGVTAKGDKNTPISEEIDALLQRSQPDVILIDDLFCFGQMEDYPDIGEIRNRIQRHKPNYRFSQVGQVFIAYPG